MARLTPLPWLDVFHFTYERRRSEQQVNYAHAHVGIEFLYIHEGTGQLIINDSYYRIAPPMLLVFQPFQLHSVHMTFPYTRSLLKVRLPVDERFAQLFPVLNDFMTILVHHDLGQQVFPLDKEQDDGLRLHFRLFHETLSLVPDQEKKELFYSFLAQFLSFFKSRIYPDNYSLQTDAPPRGEIHIEKVMKWLEEHYQEEFHLERLAAEVHLSPSYISRLFRKYMGSTIVAYLSKKRLEEASLLLRTSSLSVMQIAAASGFSDPAYFCRSFKKKYGATPLQFRRREL